MKHVLDESVMPRLRAALDAIGAVEVEAAWRVVGSQELDRVTYAIGAVRLVVEVETYVGITLVGPTELVARIVTLVSD